MQGSNAESSAESSCLSLQLPVGSLPPRSARVVGVVPATGRATLMGTGSIVNFINQTAHVAMSPTLLVSPLPAAATFCS